MRSATNKSVATIFLVGITSIGMAACFSEDTVPEEAGESELLVEGPSDESCEGLHAWAQANKERLPTSYSGLASYSMRYRKAIFVALSSEQRSELWKEHLNRYLDSSQEMPAVQTKLLRQARANISPDYFLGDEGRARASELEKQVREAFSQEQARAIFASLGPPEHAASITLARIDCECSSVSTYCNGFACPKGRNDCRPHGKGIEPGGCGFLWQYECDGMCNTD